MVHMYDSGASPVRVFGYPSFTSIHHSPILHCLGGDVFPFSRGRALCNRVQTGGTKVRKMPSELLALPCIEYSNATSLPELFLHPKRKKENTKATVKFTIHFVTQYKAPPCKHHNHHDPKPLIPPGSGSFHRPPASAYSINWISRLCNYNDRYYSFTIIPLASA